MNHNIYDLIDKFDFEKVRAYMILTDWKWINHTTGKMEIPTIEQMKATCDMLLRKMEISDIDNTRIGTGGFYVRRFNFDTSDHYCYELSFEICRSSNF